MTCAVKSPHDTVHPYAFSELFASTKMKLISKFDMFLFRNSLRCKWPLRNYLKLIIRRYISLWLANFRLFWFAKRTGIAADLRALLLLIIARFGTNIFITVVNMNVSRVTSYTFDLCKRTLALSPSLGYAELTSARHCSDRKTSSDTQPCQAEKPQCAMTSLLKRAASWDMVLVPDIIASLFIRGPGARTD